MRQTFDAHMQRRERADKPLNPGDPRIYSHSLSLVISSGKLRYVVYNIWRTLGHLVFITSSGAPPRSAAGDPGSEQAVF
jgi:hypothetical protein